MNKTSKITKTAMIAGIYAAITFATFFMSFGSVQFRVSEALTILPVFTVTSIPGLTIGCLLANLIGFFTGANPLGLIDALFGTTATLIAAILTYFIGKSNKNWLVYLLAPLPPVLINAIIVGFELTTVFNPNEWNFYIIHAASVLFGQAVICYGLGVPLMIALKKNDLYKRIFK